MGSIAPPLPQGFAPGDVIAAGEVAAMLRVDSRTVVRWDASGRLPALLRTPAGHRRWHRSQAEAARDGLPVPAVPLPALPEWMTTAEVAAAFGVSQAEIRRWVRAGVLPPPVRTPGGHARHQGALVAAVMRGEKPGGAAGAG